MSANSNGVLSPKEAARRIFNTMTPTDQQVGVVIREMKSGALKRSTSDSWTTTLEAVVEYLSRQERRKYENLDRNQAHGSTPIGPQGQTISKFYHGLIHDYFMAVVMQRGIRNQSLFFQRLVISTQVVLLCAGVSLVIYTTALMLKTPFVTPEQQTVQNWLNERYSRVEINSMKPADKAPNAVVVRFKYQESGRVIESKLIITMQNQLITSVDSVE